MDIVLQKIGIVRNEYDRRPEGGWKTALSEIVIEPQYADGLTGIDDYSHIVVLFWLDQMSADDRLRLRVRPRGLAELPEVGVFSTRSQHRPNPIGVSTVRLLRRKELRLTVSGLDAVDGTPVMDLKGYISVDDEGYRYPGWVDLIRALPY